MRNKLVLASLLIVALALIAGCATTGPQVTPVPATKTPKPTFTATPDWTPTPVVFPTATEPPATNTPEASPTPEATEVPPTPTPPPVTQFTATQNVNVRSGPGTSYPVTGRLSAGDTHEITGKNEAGDWLQFQVGGNTGWITAGLVTVTGDLNTVEIAAAPPPPTPRPTARPQPRPTNPPPAPTTVPPTAAPQFPFQYAQGSANCQPNAGTTYFNGLVKYNNGTPQNGVCIHIAFFGPRQTKCSGCGNVGNGNWGFSPFGGGPPPAGTTVEIYVVTCQGVPEGGQSQATGFSDLTPRSDKWVRTLNQGEQCTNITFVGG